MKIGSVSIWLDGHEAPDAKCISLCDDDVFLHGTDADLAKFRDEITRQIDPAADTMALLKRCVLAIEAIHRQIEEYADIDPDLAGEAHVTLKRVYVTEAKELYDAYHAAVNVVDDGSAVEVAK